jgi:protein-L-isoaspartate(D-aspartate) O-methyltransferase
MSSPPQSVTFAAERIRMVESQLRQRGVHDERALEAMRRVPRHQFVPQRYQAQAYEDHPIPIGFGQTISQPYIVALMLEALSLQPSDRVLEVGTGSGYQTALLAELAAQVCSIERHAPLAENAASILRSLGYTNVTVLVGDGSKGLPEQAPFDAIIVSAAAPKLPAALFHQLAEGGRMIVPVGPPEAQELQLIRKRDGRPAVSHLEGCRFVPLIGGEGYACDE